ncbi:hypothetical protein WJX79_007300 [Trebouxia sp. C0005]
MPETRNTQHSYQRHFFVSQRQRRNAQAPPHCCQTREGLSNLQSFLVNTAPCFPAGNQISRLEGSCNADFNLELLWKAYEAWSAYGAEVPLAVPAEDASQVTQCYVPFLSGLQLFEHSPTARHLHRCSYTSDEDFPDSLNSDLTSATLAAFSLSSLKPAPPMSVSPSLTGYTSWQLDAALSCSLSTAPAFTLPAGSAWPGTPCTASPPTEATLEN